MDNWWFEQLEDNDIANINILNEGELFWRLRTFGANSRLFKGSCNWRKDSERKLVADKEKETKVEDTNRSGCRCVYCRLSTILATNILRDFNWEQYTYKPTYRKAAPFVVLVERWRRKGARGRVKRKKTATTRTRKTVIGTVSRSSSSSTN